MNESRGDRLKKLPNVQPLNHHQEEGSRQLPVLGSRSLPAARGRWALVPTVVRRKRHPLCDRVTNYAKLYPLLAAICNKINLPNYARLDKYGTPPTRDSNEWVRGTEVRLWISYQWEQREQGPETGGQGGEKV